MNPQTRWQAAALSTLLTHAGAFDRGPWLPSSDARKLIEDAAGCTPQAASGALRALRTVGLAATSETHEGVFWKATDAAKRAQKLLQGSAE